MKACDVVVDVEVREARQLRALERTQQIVAGGMPAGRGRGIDGLELRCEGRTPGDGDPRDERDPGDVSDEKAAVLHGQRYGPGAPLGSRRSARPSTPNPI